MKNVLLNLNQHVIQLDDVYIEHWETALDAQGNLTQEVKDWLPFAEALLNCWLTGNRDTGREIFVCPELGPVDGGYALSTFPNSWEDAKVLRVEIDHLWTRLTGSL